MAKRWAIYDYDQNEMAVTTVYRSYEEASDDADQLSNVIVICLGDITTDDEGDEVDADEHEQDEQDVAEPA
jgi:hypothetical protein